MSDTCIDDKELLLPLLKNERNNLNLHYSFLRDFIKKTNKFWIGEKHSFLKDKWIFRHGHDEIKFTNKH